MRTRGWTITGASVVAFLTAAGGIVAANTEPIIDGIKAAASLATTEYVDGKYMQLAGDIDVQGKQLGSIGNLLADQMVSNIEFQLEVARKGLVIARADVAANLNIAALQVVEMTAAARVEDLELQLERARCYRSQIISGQGGNCRNEGQ